MKALRSASQENTTIGRRRAAGAARTRKWRQELKATGGALVTIALDPGMVKALLAMTAPGRSLAWRLEAAARVGLSVDRVDLGSSCGEVNNDGWGKKDAEPF